VKIVNRSVTGDLIPETVVPVSPRDGFLEVLAKDKVLRYGEVFESPLYSVSHYRKVVLYVVPATLLPTQDRPEVMYRLDAYFTIAPGDTVLKTFKDSKPTLIKRGWNDFGGVRMGELTEGGQAKEISMFDRLTTGATSTGVLVAEVYGPYLRVVLKNLTQGDKQQFVIVGYFIPA
jgi:hypothetical protein